MNRRASEYMQILAKCGSVTRAADQLFITPSALSKYITNLEREAGVPLFSRVGKHFVLTYAGERYLDWCMRMDAAALHMQNEMYDISEQKKGRIRIGTQGSISDILVKQVVPVFMREYPGICVCLTEDTSLSILQQIKGYQLDAAISTEPPDMGPFYQEPLFAMDHVLLVPQEHPLVSRAIHKPGYPYPWVDLDWCRGERFVMMHPGQSPRVLADELLAPIRDDIQVVMEVRSMRTMIEAVENRIGIIQSGAGMDLIYANEWHDLVKLSFDHKSAPTVYSLYYHKEIYHSRALDAFLDIARAQFRHFEAEYRHA